MTARIDDQDRCATPHCTRILTGRTMITTRDGRRFCKHHGHRLPAYLRKPSRSKKQKTPA
jgi:hypothetical protein